MKTLLNDERFRAGLEDVRQSRWHFRFLKRRGIKQDRLADSEKSLADDGIAKKVRETSPQGFFCRSYRTCNLDRRVEGHAPL
jgi:hypothetical protein